MAQPRSRLIGLRKKQVIIRDVRDADHQYSYAPFGAVDDAGRNMNDGAFAHGMFHAVESDGAFAFEHIIKLGAAFVVMRPCAVNIHRVRPGCDAFVFILPAQQEMTPAASAAFLRRVGFMSNQGG